MEQVIHGDKHETQELFCKNKLVSMQERHKTLEKQFPQGGRQTEQAPDIESP
jgi:hypothetical protein